MSPGRGLEESLECEQVLDVLRLQAMPNNAQNLERDVICPWLVSSWYTYRILCGLPSEDPGFLGPVEMTQTVMKGSLLISIPSFTYF